MKSSISFMDHLVEVPKLPRKINRDVNAETFEIEKEKHLLELYLTMTEGVFIYGSYAVPFLFQHLSIMIKR
jgi:hypothetical protein